MIPITEPLPLAAENDPAWVLSAEWLNLLARKVNALTNVQARPPLRVVATDTGLVFSAGKAGMLPEEGLPEGYEPTWQLVTLCIDGVTTNYYVLGAEIPA